MNKVYDESYRVAWEALRDEIIDMISNGYDPKLDAETLRSVIDLMKILHV